jgi:hypothetical protein
MISLCVQIIPSDDDEPTAYLPVTCKNRRDNNTSFMLNISHRYFNITRYHMVQVPTINPYTIHSNYLHPWFRRHSPGKTGLAEKMAERSNNILQRQTHTQTKRIKEVCRGPGLSCACARVCFGKVCGNCFCQLVK